MSRCRVAAALFVLACLSVSTPAAALLQTSTASEADDLCHIVHRHKRHKSGVKMNYTLFGTMDKQPVLIINTLSRGAREWDEFARLLCQTTNFSVAIVHAPVYNQSAYWRVLLMITTAREEMSSKKTDILFAKRTGAVYAVKYAVKVGFANISRIGLVSPNITQLGDIWVLNKFKGRMCVFWNIADRSVDYFASAVKWESSIMPPMITVRDTRRALSHQLFNSMYRFAKYGMIMRANYSVMNEDDLIDPATEDIVVYE